MMYYSDPDMSAEEDACLPSPPPIRSPAVFKSRSTPGAAFDPHGPGFTVIAGTQVIAPSQITQPNGRIDPLVSLERPAADAPVRLLVMGSGGSAAVPDIACTTSPETGCEGCLKTLSPGGTKNIRGNTGAVLRVPQSAGGEKTILIDCGKTFREQALKYFAKAGLRQIDAVILTHHHADAIDGLDDLRAWTYKTAIQKTIPIYCTQTTFDFIQSGFPYMIDKKAASGGGAVPSFQWHVTAEDEPWWIQGIRIVPIPVHHGVYFTTPPSPLICLGFLINSSILYMSDVSFIPPSAWEIIRKEVALPNPSTGKFPTQRGRTLVPLPRLQALIVDCTGLKGSTSHFGLPQTLDLALRLRPVRTYLTDMPHATSHECWLHFCKKFGQGRRARQSLPGTSSGIAKSPPPFPREHVEGEQQPRTKYVYEGFDSRAEDFHLFTERALEAVEDWIGGPVAPAWVRPLADGMTISWTEGDDVRWDDERVWDDEYESEEE